MLLTYREETKQPCPITGLPAPWVLSSAGKLIRYLHGSYFLPYHNNVSTPDASADAATRQSQTVNCCHVLFMTYWHKFQMISNGCFVVSSVDRPQQDNCLIRCRHGVSLLLFHRCFPLLFFYLPSLSFCRRSARLMSVMCTNERSLLCIMSRHDPYCWLATSLFWYSALTRFLKQFWKNAYPTFKANIFIPKNLNVELWFQDQNSWFS